MAVAIACRIPRRQRSAAVQGRAQGVRPRDRASIRSNDDAKVQLGELFLRKYNFDDAQKTFDEVLQSNPNDPRALLGAARRLEADGQAGGDSLLRAALNVNPDYVDARTLHAEMLLEPRGLRGGAAGHRSRAEGESGRRARARRSRRRSSS